MKKVLRPGNNNIKIGNNESSKSRNLQVLPCYQNFLKLHFVDIRYVSYSCDVLPLADFIVSHTEKPQSLLYVINFTRIVKTRLHITLQFDTADFFFTARSWANTILQLYWCKTKHVSYVLRKAIQIV